MASTGFLWVLSRMRSDLFVVTSTMHVYNQEFTATYTCILVQCMICTFNHSHPFVTPLFHFAFRCISKVQFWAPFDSVWTHAPWLAHAPTSNTDCVYDYRHLWWPSLSIFMLTVGLVAPCVSLCVTFSATCTWSCFSSTTWCSSCFSLILRYSLGAYFDAFVYLSLVYFCWRCTQDTFTAHYCYRHTLRLTYIIAPPL